MARTYTITTQYNGKSFTFEGTSGEAEALAALIAKNHGGSVVIARPFPSLRDENGKPLMGYVKITN